MCIIYNNCNNNFLLNIIYIGINGNKYKKFFLTSSEQPKAAIEPIRKGTDVRLNSLEISGIATLVCTKFKAIMACGRCSNKVDVGVSIPSQSNSSAFSIGCPYCSSKGSAMFHRCIVHGRQNSMGFFNLDGCQVVDVLLDGCEFLLSCFNCMKNSTVKVRRQ